MPDKKFLNKEQTKERIDELKLLVKQSEQLAKNNKRYRETIDRLVCQFVTAKDVGRKVQYLFGESETIREGKLVRAPSAGKPNFTVEAVGADGTVKNLPRSASAFVGFVD